MYRSIPKSMWFSSARVLLAAAGLAVAGPLAADPPGGAGETIDPSRLEVVDMLARIADKGTMMFNNPRRAAVLEEELRRTDDLPRKVGIAFALGRELLGLGRTQEALDLFLEIRGQFDVPGRQVPAELRRQLGEQLAIAYLRLGEQENCLAGHTAASCILPIAPEGRHRVERGARGALAELAVLMRSAPDPGLRWLINVTAMTVGEYPGGVPEEWRIPPEAFDSEYPLPAFPDRAGPAGVDVFGTSGGVALEDFDGDGRLDLVVSGWAVDEQLRYLRSRGDGTFEDQTLAAGLGGQLGGLNLVHADYDNDGRPDVLVLRGAWLGPDGLHPNSLLHNEGPGPDGNIVFRDRTREAGLLSFFPTHSAAWADFDLDGWLDVFVGNETVPGLEAPSQLFRNRGDGTFVNVAAAAGLDVRGFVKGGVWGDVDRDGRPDLFLSRFGEPNQLFHNDGPGADGVWRFTDVTATAGVAEPRMSFPAWFWDYDNDGWLDLLVAPYSGLFGDSLAAVAADFLGQPTDLERGRLYRNQGRDAAGVVRFRDVSAATGFDRPLLAMGANFGDLDNDGWLDAYFGTGEPDLKTLIPNRMFRNDGGRRFQDVTTAGGFGHLQKGHGIAWGDLDNDGDQEVYAVMGGAYVGDSYPNALFVNPGSANGWVTLVLEGVKSNRSAIGALVRLVAAGPDGERELWRTVGTGGSFGSSSLQLEIGLGTATRIDRVEVRWPVAAGTTEIFRGLEPGSAYRLRQSSGRAERLDRPRIHLGGDGEPPPHQHPGQR
jgi:hypothetical protein